MAEAAYKPRTQETVNKILEQMRRRAALTGNPSLPAGTVEEVTRGTLAVDAQAYSQNLKFQKSTELQERSLDMQEEQIEAQGKAAAVSGGVTLASIPIQYNLANKAITSEAARTAAYNARTAVMEGGINAPAAIPTPPVPAAVTGTSAAGPGILAGGEVAGAGLEEALIASGDTGIGAASSTPIGGTTAAGVNVLGYLGPIGIGLTVGGLFDDTPAGKAGGAIVAGATSYYAAKVIFNINPVAGMIVGGLTALIGDDATVICSELHRRGDISRYVRDLDALYASRHISNAAYQGYLKWAVPTVEVMRKNRLVYHLVRPVARCWAYTMANKMNPHYRVTWYQKVVGHLLIDIGVPICELIYRRDRRWQITLSQQ